MHIGPGAVHKTKLAANIAAALVIVNVHEPWAYCLLMKFEYLIETKKIPMDEVVYFNVFYSHDMYADAMPDEIEAIDLLSVNSTYRAPIPERP